MNQWNIKKASDTDAFLFCDTHCHLDAPCFESITQNVLDDAYREGVREILLPAVGEWNFNAIVDLCATNDYLYPALGLHPLYIERHQDEDLIKLDCALRQTRCAAIGEIGLDFALHEQYRDKQERFLIQQLEMANQYRLPVTIHSRKSHDALSKILKTHRPIAGGSVHGFTGSYEQAKRFVDLGLHIGVGGSITYPRAQKTRKTISRLPTDVLLLETDAPDMPIHGYQGEINVPSRITSVFASLVELKNENPLDMCHCLRKMSRILFFSA